MPQLDRAGVRIHYEDHGHGLPVLLSHGYSASSRMWKDQVAAFKDRYRIIVWDMRGHGQSDYPEDQAEYSEAKTVEDMAAILKACGVDKAVIGGLSLGGVMSLAFHIAHPEMCQALMLFDTGPGFRKDDARDAWNANAEARAKRFEAEGLAALGKSDEVQVSPHRDATGLARAARGMLAQQGTHLIDSLATVKVPTLVLAGTEDKPFLAATDYMAAKIPGARKVMIPDAGHAANLHQPKAFNEAMGAFLADVAAKGA